MKETLTHLTIQDIIHMRTAKIVAGGSNCKRRKIGAAVVPGKNDNYVPNVFVGSNSTHDCEVCGKANGDECRAVHAEISAVVEAGASAFSNESKIYVWCEVPCMACLTYLYYHSNVREIFCLTQKSYAKIYPNVLNYTEQIAKRREYAKKCGFAIYFVDAGRIS